MITKKIKLLFVIVVIYLICYMCLNILDMYSNNKKAKNIQDVDIVLGGEVVGIKLLATGVLVVGIDRNDTGLEIADVILKVNDIKIETNAELQKFVKESNGNSLKLEVMRKDRTFETEISLLLDDVTNEYRLGLWVKDSSAGVGTITFYDKKSRKFAALGHPVTETKENYILPITSGGVTSTEIYNIKKGYSKEPGELKGTITTNVIGEIYYNTERGIFGSMYDARLLENKEKINIGYKNEIKETDALIYCTIDNKQEMFKIKIEKVIHNSNNNKNMIIKITDERLLEKTGGIVQGMSGSPIIQDGKLIGAVTHVFYNDATRGYGVFIENMIEDMFKEM